MNKSGYFPSFRLPPWFGGPNNIRDLLHKLWHQCYPDLYEENCANPQALKDAESRVLTACLAEDESAIGHRRLISMASTLCSAVSPTVEAYLPSDQRSGNVIARLREGLRAPETASAEDLFPMFPQKVTPPQALHEALDVLYQSLRALDRENAMDALQEILDDCLEGYAIFPGSDGRRDLFNWWLLEVVPAAWHLRQPDFIYTMRSPWPPPHAH